jgi:carboxypeptidase T
MKNLIAFFCCLFFVLNTFGQGKSVIRIEKPSEEDYKTFVSQKYDIAAYRPGIFIDLVVSKEESDQLEAQGFKLNIMQTYQQMKDNMVAGKALAGYRTYSDTYNELLAIQTAHPTFCKLYDIGDSRGKEYTAAAYTSYKHDIWALKVSNNVATEEDEPCVFYMGEHHAREPISLEVAMYVLNYLISNYGTDPDVTYYINNTQIWFTPLVNPNGHKIVTDEVDLNWRKNIRDNNGSNTINTGTTDGVDLNRNYGWEWGGEGTSHVSSDITYCGPSAFSEPETMAMKNLLDSHHFVSGITYHSYSELVLYPYGYAQNMTAPDNAAMSQLAVNMANTIPGEYGGYYTPQPSWQLYSASGVTDDYAYGEHGIFSYTIELGVEFIPPSSDILPICQKNLTAALLVLDRVNQSTVTGLVRDANTNLPVIAEVYVNGIDNTGQFREPYTSDASFGRYYRMLVNGNYSITFSAYGYIPQTFNNVNINGTTQTILDVNLVPALSVTVTGLITDNASGLPIEGATVEVMDAPVSTAITNAIGEYTISNLMEGTYNFRVSKLNYATIIQPTNVTVANHVFNFQMEVSTAWSFESGGFEPQWTFSGSTPWYVTNAGAYDGLYCSHSGAIGNSANSDMDITLTFSSGGVISFYRKVSSEAGYDYLRFYIDGVQQGSWAGEIAWSEVFYPVTAGTHTMKWSYIKDEAVVSGSDCAWVDFINFPPIIPPPDPADISINPLSFTQSLPVNASIDKQLNIANLGEADLTFTATVEYLAGNKGVATVYPVNAAYNTGTTTTSSKTYNSLVRAYPPSEAGWMKFDVSSIPDGATINSVEFHGYINTNNYPWWSITPVTNDPVTATASVLYSDIVAEGTTGFYLFRNESGTLTNGWITYMLGGNVNTNLASALTQNWFAIGIMDRDANTYYIGFHGWNEANKPYLVINYTYVPPYTWLKVDGLNSTNGTVTGGNNQNLTVTFNSTGLSLGTYNANIKIASNDADEPLLTVPCVLNVINQFSLDLTVLLEGPFFGTEMSTTLNTSGLLPLNQPYNTTPWNYSGTESVPVIPNVNVVDWVLVELRDAATAATATPATRIARMAGFLLSDGSVVAMDGSSNLLFSNSIIQQLFVVIYHRNHLGVLSANGLSQAGGVYSYNFSTGAGQVYLGSNYHKEIAPGIWGELSGNTDGDISIAQDDKDVLWDLQAGTTGYKAPDLNLDGQVNNLDKDSYWVPNLGGGSSVPQ